jgi:hypothetical protein
MKTYITIILIFIVYIGYAQNTAFVSGSFTNIGQSLQAGAIVNNKVLTIGYSAPIRSAINPFLVFVMGGRQFEMGKAWRLTTSAGLSINKDMAAIGSAELGKDYHRGRLFVSANYCKLFFAGGGIKVFFK